MSQRIAVMSDGEIVQIGSPSDVYERPRTRFVSEFLGTANIFGATVVEQAAPDVWRVRLDAGQALATVRSERRLAAGERVQLAVRPEKLRLGPPGGDGIGARVQDVVFRGSYLAYEPSVAG